MWQAEGKSWIVHSLALQLGYIRLFTGLLLSITAWILQCTKPCMSDLKDQSTTIQFSMIWIAVHPPPLFYTPEFREWRGKNSLPYCSKRSETERCSRRSETEQRKYGAPTTASNTVPHIRFGASRPNQSIHKKHTQWADLFKAWLVTWPRQGMSCCTTLNHKRLQIPQCSRSKVT